MQPPFFVSDGVGLHPRPYGFRVRVNVKVLDFIKFGGPKWIVGGTVFEMWLGAL